MKVVLCFSSCCKLSPIPLTEFLYFRRYVAPFKRTTGALDFERIPKSHPVPLEDHRTNVASKLPKDAGVQFKGTKVREFETSIHLEVAKIRKFDEF